MILGIDQGTTGTTAVLLDESGKSLGSFTAAVPQHFPHAGWVEHDPEQIWQSVEASVRGVLSKLQKSAADIRCIGITNQRETVSLFDGDRALHRFIVWQDRRTAEYCKKISRHAKTIRSISGTPIDPYFSSSKIRWLLDHLKIKKAAPSLRFRTIDSFLFSKLCGEDAIEATNAHRTQLLDLKKISWSKKLLGVFRIPESLCPPIVSSEGFEFKTKSVGFLPAGIPVCAALGDQQAALFGQLGWERGLGKITFGTGSFILLNTGTTPIHSKQLVSTLALQWKNKKSLYALEGSVFICGAWVQWLRDQLRVISSSDEIEALAHECQDPDGVFVVPALSGLGAPFWRANARGLIAGLTRGSNRAHLARASLEALAFQNKALIDSIQKDAKGLKLKEWKVDGGAVKNNLLLQIQSNALNLPLSRPRNLEATASGVALLAGLSKGLLTLDEIRANWEEDKKFFPQSAEAKTLRARYSEWFSLCESKAFS